MLLSIWRFLRGAPIGEEGAPQSRMPATEATAPLGVTRS
jgi:hypothetical protein